MLKSMAISLFPDLGTFIKIGNLEIRWYAICILVGAVLAFLWCKKTLKKEGKDETMYDNFFLFVLPIAIIGARIWYVIAEWENYKGASFFDIIDIRSGGLAIQGGVIAGLAFGIWYFLKHDKKHHISYHTDLILPSVFIGQALGRWGNFFNQEVYGECVSRSNLWMFPDFILNNMIPNSNSPASAQIDSCPVGEVHLPLFLIESILTILGFALIGYWLRKYWKKNRKPFDLTFLYILYYGVVRTVMEPLRDSKFQMGSNNNTSVILSIIFIVVGVVGLIVTRFIYKNKNYSNLYVNEKYQETNIEEKIMTKEEMIEAKKAEIRKQRELEKENHQENKKE